MKTNKTEYIANTLCEENSEVTSGVNSYDE